MKIVCKSDLANTVPHSLMRRWKVVQEMLEFVLKYAPHSYR